MPPVLVGGVPPPLKPSPSKPPKLLLVLPMGAPSFCLQTLSRIGRPILADSAGGRLHAAAVVVIKPHGWGLQTARYRADESLGFACRYIPVVDNEA